MTLYLLHLDTPLGISRHYLGYTKSPRSVAERLQYHRSGQGARFTQVCNERGITYDVVRVWRDGSRALERHIKDKHRRYKKLCPICNPASWSRNMADDTPLPEPAPEPTPGSDCPF